MEELRKALKLLGVTGRITTAIYDRFTVTVYVDGKKFGIWDPIKHTFVA